MDELEIKKKKLESDKLECFQKSRRINKEVEQVSDKVVKFKVTFW